GFQLGGLVDTVLGTCKGVEVVISLLPVSGFTICSGQNLVRRGAKLGRLHAIGTAQSTAGKINSTIRVFIVQKYLSQGKIRQYPGHIGIRMWRYLIGLFQP